MKRLGTANLEALNNGASINGLARFATGGYVGSSPAVVSGRSGSGDVTIAPTIHVDSGGNTSASTQSNASNLNRKITAAVKAVVANERKQGGALWKMQNGIA